MANDIDGYGFAAEGRTVGRLTADLRELDRYGIERFARGWDKVVGESGLDEFSAAEQTAAEILEHESRVGEWHEVRDILDELTAGEGALTSWRAEPTEVGRKAERAALAAALGLVAGADSGHPEVEILLRPAAEALPWLLLEDLPQPDLG
ncbi:MAG: hypothetical protein ACREN1_07540 [Candidatus Dormibacteria bacterium]